MYIVVHPFHDIQDKDFIYLVGDVYPREGYTPEKSRIEQLTTCENALKMPLIEAVKNSKKKKGV